MNKDLSMARQIAEKVKEHGGTTYFVGGYVRDKILGKQNKDIDIEVHNITPEDLKSILSKMGNINTQGVSFGVYNIKGYDIDIAQPRMETANGRGHKDFEVTVDPFIGTKSAAKRRDFTMNALMEDVLTGEIVDHFGGLDDIANGVIRHVDDNTFKEDSLRVLRGAQFAARFGFTIAPETQAIMKEMDLSELSSERVYSEMKKALLKSDKPSIFFEELRCIGQLHTWFPEIEALDGCEQNPLYHPEGDVFVHTMNVVDAAKKVSHKTSNPEYFMVSALCHDFGKPKSLSVEEDGAVHHYGHAEMGVEVIEPFFDRINHDKKLGSYVRNMVGLHMQVHDCYNHNSRMKKTNCLFDKSVSPDDLCLLAYADVCGKGDETAASVEYAFLKERAECYKERMKEPEVMGEDLIKIGLKPGPRFSEILQNAHKQHLAYVDKDKVLKGIQTCEEKLARKRAVAASIGIKDDTNEVNFDKNL